MKNCVSGFLLFGKKLELDKLSNFSLHSSMNFCEYSSFAVAIVSRTGMCLCNPELKINCALDVYLNSRDLFACFLPSRTQSS